jgi:hypothetical protein
VPALGASASEAPAEPETLTQQLGFSGFNSEIAAENGYEMRTNTTGEQLVVPLTNAPGDFTNGTPMPAPVDDEGDVVVDPNARGVAPNDCGDAAIFFEGNFGNEYSTSYTFTLAGGAYEHTWRVAAFGATGAQSYNLDGLAPFGGVGWVSGLKDFGALGTANQVGVSQGIVYGVLGFTCVALGPVDYRLSGSGGSLFHGTA